MVTKPISSIPKYSYVINKQKIYHYAAIHHKKWRYQPVSKDMGVITNGIKKVGHATRYTTQQLLESLSSGQNVLLSNFELDQQNSIRFLSSSTFAIDVDDDEAVTNPLQVLNDLKSICVGLFYTFSHTKKGNRYRLLFQLDQSITNQDELSALIDYMIHFLKNKGLPVDGKANSPTQIVRGGIAGYEVNDFSVMLKVNDWMPKAKQRAAARLAALEAHRKERSKQLSENMNNPILYEELKEMCESIGHLPSGSGDEVTEKWLQITYALKYHTESELIDENQGYELFNIISGGESTEKYWNSVKPVGHVTVGTIIFHAQQAGYKRKHKYGYALQDAPEPIQIERIRVKEHIQPETAKKLLQRRERLLIDSPTGSGKTTAFMQAFKELECIDHHFYIFAAPTIPLTLQVAEDHKVMDITGDRKNLSRVVRQHAMSGGRIFVATYNKVAELLSYLEDFGGAEFKYTLVVDEVHKLTTDFNYRFKEINEIEELKNNAYSYIGLSGTPEDVLKDNFEKMIKIDNGINKSPCTDFRVFTYSREDEADTMLIPVIEGVLKQTKLLLFINSKERAIRISDVLRKRGVVVRVVTSDTKKNKTYKDIVERQHIEDEVQVVIATTVIADGISIKNSLNWSCIVATDKSSPIYNPSTIKQISNRFRNTYRYFGLYMLEPKRKEDEEARPFNTEVAYQYNKKVVTSYTKYLNEEYRNEELGLFTPSAVERSNGIYLKANDEETMITHNPLSIRFLAMKKKENYYRAYRDVFIKRVSKALGHKLTEIMNVTKSALSHGIDLSELTNELATMKEFELEKASHRRNSFEKEFTESIYGCYLRDDEEALKHFIEDVHPDQHAATKLNSRITNYETCKKLGIDVKRRADIKKFYKNIQALADIASFELNDKKTVTKRIFSELSKLSEPIPSKDLKEFTEKVLHKQLRVKPSDVKDTLDMFNRVAKRNKNERLTKLEPLTIKIVAKQHGISESAVKSSIFNYINTRDEQQRKVLFDAASKKWGIEC